MFLYKEALKQQLVDFSCLIRAIPFHAKLSQRLKTSSRQSMTNSRRFMNPSLRYVEPSLRMFERFLRIVDPFLRCFFAFPAHV